jgi:hypothetical protein
MSPLEIPGTVIVLINPPGKYTCPSCKRDFSSAKLRKSGDVVKKCCPACNRTIKTYSFKALEKKANKK